MNFVQITKVSVVCKYTLYVAQCTHTLSIFYNFQFSLSRPLPRISDHTLALSRRLRPKIKIMNFVQITKVSIVCKYTLHPTQTTHTFFKIHNFPFTTFPATLPASQITTLALSRQLRPKIKIMNFTQIKPYSIYYKYTLYVAQCTHTFFKIHKYVIFTFGRVIPHLRSHSGFIETTPPQNQNHELCANYQSVYCL